MHPQAHIDQALGLAARGLNASEIARRTGHPRSTIRSWLDRPAGGGEAGTCEICGGHPDAAANASDYAYLLGLYLGDGCIASHPRSVYRLRLFLDAGYPSIVAEAKASIATLLPANKIGEQRRSGGFERSAPWSNVEVSCYSECWPCLIPQHGPGRKHERPIELADWQQEIVDAHPGRLLRGLIHSDGCRFINTGRGWSAPRYSFSNRSDDIRRIFCGACERLGLRWTSAPHTVYVSRIADVAVLDEHIGPRQVSLDGG